MSYKVKGFDDLNKSLEELRKLGKTPSYQSKRNALEAGAMLVKLEAIRLAPTRSAKWAARGANFGMTRKAIRLNEIFRAGNQFDVSISRGRIITRNAGKKATTLKESIRYDVTTGVSRDSLGIRIFARKPSAHLVELGHATRQGRGKAKNYKPKSGGISRVSPRSFMKRALESKGAAAVDAVASQLGESLERVLKRIKKRGA